MRIATATPIIRANVVTISKYNNAFTPTRPTFFKFPMLTIPKVIVRKIIGLMKSLTVLIKIPDRNSLRVEPIVVLVLRILSLKDDLKLDVMPIKDKNFQPGFLLLLT